ncbi:hypothetical protein C0992_002725 [Termitomyces sp. T32_za158]|nr:hypothetical protein C0992_002725 [Termitomyces sp. T32_za158]
MSDLDETPGPQKASKLVMDIGFGTPVLKPREARRSDRNTGISQTKDSVFSNVENVLEKRVPRQKRKRKQPRSLGSRKGSSINGSEKEYKQRLKERRERKRVKRAVMKSASNDDSLDESSAEGTQGKNKMIKKTAKNIGLAGFALMHGFTATNVGKGRLTVALPICHVTFFETD